MKVPILFTFVISTCLYGVFPATNLFINNQSNWDINYKAGEVYHGKLPRKSGELAYIGSLENALKNGVSITTEHHNTSSSMAVKLNEAAQLASKNPEQPLLITITPAPRGYGYSRGRCNFVTSLKS